VDLIAKFSECNYVCFLLISDSVSILNKYYI
jgi:hypothetical protein